MGEAPTFLSIPRRWLVGGGGPIPIMFPLSPEGLLVGAMGWIIQGGGGIPLMAVVILEDDIDEDTLGCHAGCPVANQF